MLILPPQPALDVIRAHDSPATLFYLDPPYLDETRTAPSVFKHEMSVAQHEELLEVLQKVKGGVLLSGYDSDLYRRRLKGWKTFTYYLPNQAAGGAEKRRMEEVVWRNY